MSVKVNFGDKIVYFESMERRDMYDVATKKDDGKILSNYGKKSKEEKIKYLKQRIHDAKFDMASIKEGTEKYKKAMKKLRKLTEELEELENSNTKRLG